MPDLDGFELAAMIREHPRFEKTTIIFISAIHFTDTDHLRGYEMGPSIMCRCRWCRSLRAKVRVFAELIARPGSSV